MPLGYLCRAQVLFLQRFQQLLRKQLPQRFSIDLTGQLRLFKDSDTADSRNIIPGEMSFVF